VHRCLGQASDNLFQMQSDELMERRARGYEMRVLNQLRFFFAHYGARAGLLICLDHPTDKVGRRKLVRSTCAVCRRCLPSNGKLHLSAPFKKS